MDGNYISGADYIRQYLGDFEFRYPEDDGVQEVERTVQSGADGSVLAAKVNNIYCLQQSIKCRGCQFNT